MLVVLALLVGALAAVVVYAARRIDRLTHQLATATWRADHDPLTRLANRYVLHATVDRWLDQRRPTTLAMIDLDDFRQINNVFGYAAGDTMLVFAAHRLAAHAATTGGLAIRLGGDEFVIVWPDLTTTDATAHANDLHRAHGLPQDLKGQMRRVLTRQPLPEPSCRSRVTEPIR
jgi:diguanylate cyclase (GGDEF)-like protein